MLLADPGAVVSLVDDAAKLEWMQSTWAGVNVLFSSTSKRDYVCTRVAGIFGAPDRIPPILLVPPSHAACRLTAFFPLFYTHTHTLSLSLANLFLAVCARLCVLRAADG